MLNVGLFLICQAAGLPDRGFDASIGVNRETEHKTMERQYLKVQRPSVIAQAADFCDREHFTYASEHLLLCQLDRQCVSTRSSMRGKGPLSLTVILFNPL